jgi:Domain of unknown function (DUF4410)
MAKIQPKGETLSMRGRRDVRYRKNAACDSTIAGQRGNRRSIVAGSTGCEAPISQSGGLQPGHRHRSRAALRERLPRSGSMTQTRRFLRFVGVFCTLVSMALLAGCSTRVTNTGNYATPAGQGATPKPRPQEILVEDFPADWSRVQLDQGVASRLLRQVEGTDPAGAEYEKYQQVQQVISDTLIEELRKMGFAARRASGTVGAERNELLVKGQIFKINEGNRTRRLVVGFGAGRSDVQANVQLYYVRPGAAPQLLATYDADSNSGRKPGMGVGAASAAGGGSVAPAAISGAFGAHSEKQKAPVVEEGKHLASRVASNLGSFFAQQGWIPPSAVPAASLR